MKMVQSLARGPFLGLLTTMYITIKLNVSTKPVGVQCTVITLFKLEELLSIIGSLMVF
jgi:hypothetical protein